MTDEEIRIAVAEACGLTVLPLGDARRAQSDIFKAFETWRSATDPAEFWEWVRRESLGGNYGARYLLQDSSDTRLQHITEGWVHTQSGNPLGLWRSGGCSQVFANRGDDDDRGSWVKVYCAKDVPDYPECLNAMHSAEKVLSPEQWLSYWIFLGTELQDLSVLHATARQRAEAFLRTLNLWKD